MLCKTKKQSMSVYIICNIRHAFLLLLAQPEVVTGAIKSSPIVSIRYGVDLNCKQQPLIKGRGVSYCKNLLSPRFEQSGTKIFIFS